MRLPWRIATYGPAINTSLTEHEAAELQQLGAGRRVLEIGAAYGYSTVLLAQVAEAVVSVDPHEVHGSNRALLENLKAHGVRSKVHVCIAYSHEILPYLAARQFGLIFIDGDHTAAGVGFDLAQAQRLVTEDGQLAFHDWGEETCPDVRPVLEAWRQPDQVVDTLAVYRA